MKRKRYIACSLAIVLCLVHLAGCGSSSEDTSETADQTDTSSDTSSAEETQSVSEESGYRAGLVLAVDGTQVTVQYYTPLDGTSEIAEPADFALQDYTLSQSTEVLNIEDEGVIQPLDETDGTVALSDIRPGTILLIQQDETEGTLTEVILQNSGQNGEMSIAHVVSNSETGLEILWYQPGEDAAELTSYLEVDLSGYELAETSETLAVNTDVPVYQSQDGALLEDSLDSLAAGDTVILCYNADGDLERLILCDTAEAAADAS